MRDIQGDFIRNDYDEDFIDRFYKEAIKVAYGLKSKYKPLFCLITVEDLVQESLIKALRSRSRYDSKKGSFESFVRTIVYSKCIDLHRTCVKFELYSLDYQYNISGNDDPADSSMKTMYEESSLTSAFGYIDIPMEDLVETEDIIESCYRDFNGCSLKEILDYKGMGYSDSYTASKTGFRVSNMKKFLVGVHSILLSRLSGSERTLADILYGDEDLVEEKLVNLKPAIKFVQDDETGIKLSDVIRYVLKGYSYKQIGKTLGVEKDEVKRFLDRCQEMVV